MLQAWQRRYPSGVVLVGMRELEWAFVAVGNVNDTLQHQGGVLGSAGTVAEAARIGPGPESAAINRPVELVHSALGRPVAVAVVVEALAVPGNAALAMDIWAVHGIGIAAGCYIGYPGWHSLGAKREECM